MGRRNEVERGWPRLSRKAALLGMMVVVLVVVMGVSGSGKSTAGSHLADKLGWKFCDGDDFHPEENRKKMAKGEPLNGQDRILCLCYLHDILMREHASGQNTIVACSALKKMYRCILENGKTYKCCENVSSQPGEQEGPAPQKILFVHLAGPMDMIASRLGKRKGHFMPSELLQSPFETLEPPLPPENFITISLEKPVSEIISEIEEYIRSIY